MASWKLVLTILAIPLALLLPKLFKYIQFLNFGKVVYTHRPGPCHYISGIEHGSEDMELLVDGKLLISAGYGAHIGLTNTNPGIFLFDFNKPSAAAVKLEIAPQDFDTKNFSPHGISVWTDSNGQASLFVINHVSDREVVEIFTVDKSNPPKLNHEKSVSSELFVNINDIVAVGSDQFYVTNIFHHKDFGTLRAVFDTVLMLKWADSVVYHDGQHTRMVVNDLFMANGIQRSVDSRHIYVTTLYGEIAVFKPTSEGNLEKVQSFPVSGGGLDNVDVDGETGDLWVGAHPVPNQLFAYIADTSKPSPSQVLHLKTKDGLITDMYEVFADDGRFFSGSSIAVHYKGKMAVGSVLTKALLCDVKYQH